MFVVVMNSFFFFVTRLTAASVLLVGCCLIRQRGKSYLLRWISLCDSFEAIDEKSCYRW